MAYPAMERMQYEAQEVSVGGVVGVQIIEKNHVGGHHAIEFSPSVLRSRGTGRAVPHFVRGRS